MALHPYTAPLSATSRPPRPFPLPTRSRRRSFRRLVGHGHGSLVADVARPASAADPVPVCDRGSAGTQYGDLGQGVKTSAACSVLQACFVDGSSCSSTSCLFLTPPLFLSRVYSLCSVYVHKVLSPVDVSRLEGNPGCLDEGTAPNLQGSRH